MKRLKIAKSRLLSLKGAKELNIKFQKTNERVASFRHLLDKQINEEFAEYLLQPHVFNPSTVIFRVKRILKAATQLSKNRKPTMPKPFQDALLALKSNLNEYILDPEKLLSVASSNISALREAASNYLFVLELLDSAIGSFSDTTEELKMLLENKDIDESKRESLQKELFVMAKHLQERIAGSLA